MEKYVIKGNNGFSRMVFFEWNSDGARITRDAVDHLEIIECTSQEALPELFRVIGSFVREGFQVERVKD